MVALIIVVFFGAWWLLSVFLYIPKLANVVRRIDYVALVPDWRFFAPNPLQHDYHLLYRDQYIDGRCSNWTELRPAQERCWWNAIWNPAKRSNKALFDVVTEFAAQVTAGDPGVELSVSRLTLLNYVSSVSRSTSPKFVQLMLMLSRGHCPGQNPELVYRSEFHSLC